MQTEKFTRPSNSGMQEGDQPKFQSFEDVKKGMNRQQRRAYDKKAKGLTEEQLAELNKKIVEGNISSGITKSWNNAITLATIAGIDFCTEKLYTDYISKIDEDGISKKDREKLIEKMLSDWRSAYLQLVIRKEKQKQTVELEKSE
jgi:hypothetical protein